MILTLFLVFLALALILITLGLFRTEHSELSLIGFVFLFLLSFIILNSNITYKIGTETNMTYSYNLLNGTYYVNATNELNIDKYTNFSDSNTHNFGYWLVIASFIGFLGVLLGLRHNKGFR